MTLTKIRQEGSQLGADAGQHADITCDHCKKPITSPVRYKCGNCCEYDLCAICEGISPLIHPSHHVFLKLRAPLSEPPQPVLKPILPRNLYNHHLSSDDVGLADACIGGAAAAVLPIPIKPIRTTQSISTELSFSGGSEIPGQHQKQPPHQPAVLTRPARILAPVPALHVHNPPPHFLTRPLIQSISSDDDLSPTHDSPPTRDPPPAHRPFGGACRSSEPTIPTTCENSYTFTPPISDTSIASSSTSSTGSCASSCTSSDDNSLLNDTLSSYDFLSDTCSSHDEGFIIIPPVPKCFDVDAPLDDLLELKLKPDLVDKQTQTDVIIIPAGDGNTALEARNSLIYVDEVMQFDEVTEHIYSVPGPVAVPSTSIVDIPHAAAQVLEVHHSEELVESRISAAIADVEAVVPKSGLVVAREKDREDKEPINHAEVDAVAVVNSPAVVNCPAVVVISPDAESAEVVTFGVTDSPDVISAAAKLSDLTLANVADSSDADSSDADSSDADSSDAAGSEYVEPDSTTEAPVPNVDGAASVRPGEDVAILPDSIEDIAEYAISKVMETGAGLAKNFMDYLQNLDEYQPENQSTWTPKEDDYSPPQPTWTPKPDNWTAAADSDVAVRPRAAEYTPRQCSWTPDHLTDGDLATHDRTFKVKKSYEYVPRVSTWTPRADTYTPRMSEWIPPALDTASGRPVGNSIPNRQGEGLCGHNVEVTGNSNESGYIRPSDSPTSTHIRPDVNLQGLASHNTQNKLAMDFEQVLLQLIKMGFTVPQEIENTILLKLKQGRTVFDTTCDATAILLREQFDE